MERILSVEHRNLAEVVRIDLSSVHGVRREVAGGVLLGEEAKLLQLRRVRHGQPRQVKQRLVVAPDELFRGLRNPALVAEAVHDCLERVFVEVP